MRIWGAGLLLLTTGAAWLLAGEVLGRRRLPQLACAACVGLIPMQTAIAGSLNPDALLVALSTVALWLGARVIMRGARPDRCDCAVRRHRGSGPDEGDGILSRARGRSRVVGRLAQVYPTERWRRLGVIAVAAMHLRRAGDRLGRRISSRVDKLPSIPSAREVPATAPPSTSRSSSATSGSSTCPGCQA